MDETTVILNDTEEFITNILGNIDLPSDVNKQRLELSQRLQKLLKKGGVVHNKPRLDAPNEVNWEEVYDDVATIIDEKEPEQEMYDDVKPEPVQELYDDVKKDELQETYDDVKQVAGTLIDNTDISTPAESGSEFKDDIAGKSQQPVSLDTQYVVEPKKASDIKDSIYKGYLEKYKTRGFALTSRWQRRYCILTPLALYYYANPKDYKQKGSIVLAANSYVLRKGSPSYPEVKDGKMCFEIGNSKRNYLFKVEKQEEVDEWLAHLRTAVNTQLSEKDLTMIRKQSLKVDEEKKTKEKKENKPKEIEEMEEIEEIQDDNGDLYELVESYHRTGENSSSSNEVEPIEEELYEDTEQFTVKESSGSSNEPPGLPSRREPDNTEEEFDELTDYEFPDVVPKPPSAYLKLPEVEELPGLKPKPTTTLVPPRGQPPKSPALPPRNPTFPTFQDAPVLPRRPANSVQPTKTPPVLPVRTTPKTVPDSPKPPPATSDVAPTPPITPVKKPEVVSSAPPPIKTKPLMKGEQFDYAKIYVAMWNCNADDADDLSFSRGNQLYIREKIPNSDWWVASLMDCPDIRVGLVPRNYIMPAYDL